MAGTMLLAHGVGVRGDLPVPLWAVSYGAAGVLVVSFVLLLRTWREPRLATASVRDLAALGRLGPVAAGVGRALGAALMGVVVASGLTGADLPAFALYVGVWVGVAFAAALVGDVWSLLNPFAGLAAIVGDGVSEMPGRLARAGLWPAAVLLAVFGWYELVHPEPASPGAVTSFVAIYLVVVGVAGLWWGADWIRRSDAFGAYFGLVSRIAPIGRDRVDGRLSLRPPVSALARVEARPGLAALVLVALGTTTFDGVTRSGWWEAFAGPLQGWGDVPVHTAGLLITILLVAGLYRWGVAASAEVSDRRTDELMAAFAPSLVPISLGYAVAHYFSLLVFEGQRMLALASDPFDLGWDLFGTAAWNVDFTAVSTTTIAVVQVLGIVVGHFAGVVVAHDRAVEILPEDALTSAQVPLLLVMIAFTITGLVLLLGA